MAQLFVLQRERNGPHILLTLFLWLCLAFAQGPGEPLGFEDAVVREAEVQVEMATANLTNAIGVPPDIAESFNITAGFDQRILQFAQLVPSAVPQYDQVDFSQALADITPPTGNETSDQIGRRQGRMRVLVVGDSISHCNERGLHLEIPALAMVSIIGSINGVRIVELQLHQHLDHLYEYPIAMIDEYGLLENMNTMIDNARRANPNMRIVIGTVPHRTFIGGRQDLVSMTDNYNRMLKERVPRWGTPTSPVRAFLDLPQLQYP
ncbi:putative SGNH hydrolase superfamily [Septoria linicola]|nr:putative SGNH hydrolase superfamily [Septoria linicola]